MRLQKTLIVLTFGVLLVAVQAPAQTGSQHDVSVKARARGLQCPRVVFSSVEKPQAMRYNFSAARSADVIFHILFDTKLSEDHVVTLKVFTPKGYLYRQFDVPLAPGTEKRVETSRRLPGYPYPVPVKTTSTLKAGKRKYESVDVPFPVAGSAIVTSSLYGFWKVEASLDGDTESCHRRSFFRIKE